MNRTLIKYFVAFFVIVGTSSCTHKVNIGNKYQYSASKVYLNKKPAIGISESDSNNKEYVEAVVKQLRKSNNFRLVYYPYYESHGKVDYIMNISVSPKYEGKTSNYFVTWPGFVLFLPKILGYGYEAKLDTEISLVKVRNKSNKMLETLDLETNYDFRHAEFDRTWVQGGGWTLATIPAFVAGFFHTGYDEDATKEFKEEVSEPYAKYVSRKIISHIQKDQ